MVQSSQDYQLQSNPDPPPQSLRHCLVFLPRSISFVLIATPPGASMFEFLLSAHRPSFWDYYCINISRRMRALLICWLVNDNSKPSTNLLPFPVSIFMNRWDYRGLWMIRWYLTHPNPQLLHPHSDLLPWQPTDYFPSFFVYFLNSNYIEWNCKIFCENS